MNSKNILGIVALILIAIVGFATTQSKNTQTAQSPTDMQSTPTQAETLSPSTSSGSMMEKSGETHVTLSTSGFTPETIMIKTGTKVVWTNKSGDQATVDSDFHPTHRSYPALNLGRFNDGETLSLTFGKAGTYNYHDHLNPSWSGTVIVGE